MNFIGQKRRYVADDIPRKIQQCASLRCSENEAGNAKCGGHAVQAGSLRNSRFGDLRYF